MTLRLPFAAAGAALLLVVLTGCGGSSENAPTPTPKSTKPASVSTAAPVDAPTPTPTSAAEPTCETIISAGTVTALTDIGWSAETRDFMIGDITLNEGLLCLWADYSVVSDHGQLYGWSPIGAEDAATAQAWLPMMRLISIS